VADPDAYGQGILITQETDPPDLPTTARNLAAGIIPRSVMRFTSASDRAADLVGDSAPVEGMVSYLTDVNRLYVYTGSTWVEIATRGYGSSTLISSTAQTSAEISTGLAVTMATKANTAYRMTVSGLLRSTLVGDRVDLIIRRGTTTAGLQVGGAVHFTTVATTGESVSGVGTDTPGAGTTTWTVFLSGVGSGLVDLTASTAFPALFTVTEQ
jgi:hypothetical protein